MRKVIDVVLILGFLFVDFLMFHDIFKVGETTTVVEYVTGALSVIVIVVSVQSLLKK
jgi:hypothetical protein